MVTIFTTGTSTNLSTGTSTTLSIGTSTRCGPETRRQRVISVASSAELLDRSCLKGRTT
jgi:hypothetical protein